MAVLGAAATPVDARPPERICLAAHPLGVSRVEVVDTTGGPRFGRQFQGEGSSFLAPGEVVLTFDDGPFSVSTGPILDTLDRYCAKATFFAVGRMAIVQPETLREVARRGHTIAGHTWAHANVARLAESRRAAEVEKGFSALTEVLGGPVAPFFRFPYLDAPASELERLAQRNIATFGIDVDSTDSHGQKVSPKRIVDRTLAGLEKVGKGIILLHDLKDSTAAALPELLDALSTKGYRLVHLVPKAKFEPNAAFSAEVAAVIAKRNAKLAAKQAKATAQVEITGSIKPPRNLRSAKAGAERTSASANKKPSRKGRKKRDRRGKSQEVSNGPFRPI
ncbi:MAG: polysaccharide deacetylase family protein [Hyphomicrobiaceae bacterium]